MKKGKIFWLTGLPCSGKTTIAEALKERLIDALILDGDYVRGTAISADVGFSPADRKKHLLRLGAIAHIAAESGTDVICAFVSPSREVRDEIRNSVRYFIEIFVDARSEICTERDVKGMWAKAKAGEISNFTGYNAPYDVPHDPEVVCNTEFEDVDQCVKKILKHVNDNFGRALYIGRWQVPQGLHDGHKFIINQSLEKNIPVLIAIREMDLENSNPYTAEEIKNKIEKVYHNEDVVVSIIPNIRSVNIGRNVGYEIVTVEAPPEIKEISATEERKKSGKN